VALGVDLGTTNSSVAWSDPAGGVHSLKVRRGPKEPFDAVERSLVLDPFGSSPIVGHLAEGAPRSSPDTPLIESFKRRFDKARLRQSRYEIVRTKTSEYDPVQQSIRIAETTQWVPLYYDAYSLEEVTKAAALMLHRLLTSTDIDVDQAIEAPGSRSVIARLLGRRGASGPAANGDAIQTAPVDPGERLYVGVPVSFGPTARRRLLRSLVESGCFDNAAAPAKEVLARCRLVYEPLALVSTMTLFESANVLVVDYGGGTLDTAFLRVDVREDGRKDVRELALGGRPAAGDRLDELFREYLLETRPGLRNSFDQQVASGPQDSYLARSAFTKAKQELSTRSSTTIRLFGDLEVTRADFERATGSELDCAVEAVTQTLSRAAASPSDVGAVLLTGGSSLIPAVQDRLRALFPHLADELAFDAGTPGDVESERRALTGVSRGLANWGFLESFEATAPCSFTVVIPDTPATSVVCLERGAPDLVNLDDAPPVIIPTRAGRRSVAIYSDLLRDTYNGAIADLDLPTGEIEVQLSAARDRFMPAFLVRDAATGTELARFDLETTDVDELTVWLNGDAEWMPPGRTTVESMFLTRPLEIGDFVEWRGNAGSRRRGKVIDIREIDTGRYVERMDGFDPEPYLIRAAIEENGVVQLGVVNDTHWRLGDVRLA
jgi:hypothetical protein